MTSRSALVLLLALACVGSAYGQVDRIDVADAAGNYSVVFYDDEGIASRGELTDVEFSRGRSRTMIRDELACWRA